MGHDAKPQGASNRRNIVWVSIAAVVGVLFVIGLVTGEEEAPAAEPAVEEPAERPAAPAKAAEPAAAEAVPATPAAAEPEPVLTLADFATEADACRSVTAAEWTPNPDALRFHRADAAVHLEATEPGGLMPLCRYTTDGGALLKLQLLELTTAAEPSARFIEAAEYVLALFAPDAAAWFAGEVSTRAKWPDGVMFRNREMRAQVVTVGNVAGTWELSITRAADYELQE